VIAIAVQAVRPDGVKVPEERSYRNVPVVKAAAVVKSTAAMKSATAVEPAPSVASTAGANLHEARVSLP
jgi:hypothetical protein